LISHGGIPTVRTGAALHRRMHRCGRHAGGGRCRLIEPARPRHGTVRPLWSRPPAATAVLAGADRSPRWLSSAALATSSSPHLAPPRAITRIAARRGRSIGGRRRLDDIHGPAAVVQGGPAARAAPVAATSELGHGRRSPCPLHSPRRAAYPRQPRGERERRS
jgi:hypothetical protein